MLKYLSLIVVLVSLGSCTFYEPEYKGGQKLQFKGIEGKEVHFTAGANVQNDNGYGIKIKPSTLDLHVEGEYIGKVHLENKVKMKRKQVSYIESPFTATLADGALFKLMKFAGNDQIQVKLSGKVKAGVWFIGKKIDVNEVRTIDASKLKGLGI